METEDRVLVIRRIHVTYVLRATSAVRDIVDRVHRMHAMSCPLYRTLRTSIDITTEVRVEDE